MAEAQPPVDAETRHASLRRIMIRNLNARDLHGRDMVEDFENYVSAAARADVEARFAKLRPYAKHAAFCNEALTSECMCGLAAALADPPQQAVKS